MAVAASDVYFSLSNVPLTDVIFAFPVGVSSYSKTMDRDLFSYEVPFEFKPFVDDFVTTTQKVTIKAKLPAGGVDPITGSTYSIYQWQHKCEQLIKNLQVANTDPDENEPVSGVRYLWIDNECDQTGARVGLPVIIESLTFEMPDAVGAAFIEVTISARVVQMVT